MSEPKLDKWLDGLRPDDPLPVVVAKSLRSRIKAVRYFLPLAAEHAVDNVEYVHQLRVWSRRTTAALRLYRPLLPKKRVAWLRRKLKKVRDAAGSARDYDVLLQRYRHADGAGHSQRFLERLQRHRRDAQEPIIAVSRSLKRGKRLKRKVKKLLASSEVDRDNELARLPFADWAGEQLARLVRRFERAAPSDPTDLAALHRFRIRGKQLRYGIELLAPAFPPELKDRIYPELQRLQQRLGALNDRAVAVRRLEHWIETEDDPAERVHLDGLMQQERQHRDRSITEFEAWWSSDPMHGFLASMTPLLIRESTARMLLNA